MTADPRRVKELFVAVLDLPDAQARQVFLEHECGDDADLRHRLDVLLRAHDDPFSALERPLAVAGPATADYHGPAEEVGAIIAGKYKLVENLGQGGMGDVFMAQQTTPVKRLVKLKLIKLGMDSRQILARFEAERQALALMDHPNIAKVLDAGATESGRPSAGYRLRKFVRKHRTALAMAATVVLLLLAGVALSTWQAVRARRADREAAHARDVAEQNEREADEQRKKAETQAASVAMDMDLKY